MSFIIHARNLFLIRPAFKFSNDKSRLFVVLDFHQATKIALMIVYKECGPDLDFFIALRSTFTWMPILTKMPWVRAMKSKNWSNFMALNLASSLLFAKKIVCTALHWNTPQPKMHCDQVGYCSKFKYIPISHIFHAFSKSFQYNDKALWAQISYVVHSLFPIPWYSLNRLI